MSWSLVARLLPFIHYFHPRKSRDRERELRASSLGNRWEDKLTSGGICMVARIWWASNLEPFESQILIARHHLFYVLYDNIRATSHTSQQPWPCNGEDPWLSSKGCTMGVGKVILGSHGPLKHSAKWEWTMLWDRNDRCIFYWRKKRGWFGLI